ncbi:FAD-binding protein [Scopulibacillus darangshiensis]|nr:FAD-binding protein [Scopulibacillus darangshiensis]
MTIKRMIKTDVLVVGAGLAGMKAAKELADKEKQILMITKTELASGASFYPLKASLGTQVTKSEEDKALFLDDIEEMSCGMAEPKLAKTYVDEIPEQVKEYEKIGVNAKKLDGERKACFAGHARNIYLLSDWDAMRQNANQIFSDYDNITLMEKTIAVSLIKRQGKIAGAILLDDNNDYVLVSCHAVILASGGFSNIYKHNLYPADVDGSGHLLALEAGAKLVNIEFIQFIPGVVAPKYKTLFGEHTLMYCDDMVADNGESLLDPLLPLGLSKKECLEIRSTHGPFTDSFDSRYFDIAMMKAILETKYEKGFKLLYNKKLYENKEEFYTVYLDWLKEKGINMVKDDIRIAPFAHAANGGVVIDENGKTDVDGLYAIGELSCNVEGANRLGGNSTGACMVFGKRAAEDCASYMQDKSLQQIGGSEAEAQLQSIFARYKTGSDNHAGMSAGGVIERIREIMWYDANIIRTEEGLLRAIKEVETLASGFSFPQAAKTASSRKTAFKAKNFITLAQILLSAMLERKESRGAHYREDYPDLNPSYNKRLFISMAGKGEAVLTFDQGGQ